MKIWYLDNSGFCLEQEGVLLVFDCWKFPKAGEGGEGFLSKEEVAGYSSAYIFVSHVHGDHFNKKVFGWAADNVTYLVDEGCPFPGRAEREAKERRAVPRWEDSGFGAPFDGSRGVLPGGDFWQNHLPRRGFKLLALGRGQHGTGRAAGAGRIYPSARGGKPKDASGGRDFFPSGSSARPATGRRRAGIFAKNRGWAVCSHAFWTGICRSGGFAKKMEGKHEFLSQRGRAIVWKFHAEFAHCS